MATLTTWSRAEIRRSWASLLAVAVLIAIAGGAVMAGAAGARRAGAAVDRFAARAEVASVAIYTDDEPDDALNRQLANDAGIEHIANGRVLAITPAGVRPAMEGGMWVMPPTGLAGQREPIVLSGRLPRGAGEVALDSSTADELGVEVGSVIDLQAIDWGACFGGATEDCAAENVGAAVLVGLMRTDQDIAPDPDDWTLLIAADGVVDADVVDTASMGWITSIWPADGVDPDDIVATYAPLVDNGDVTNDIDERSGALSGARRAADLEHDAVLAAALVAAVAGLAIVGQAHARFLARRRSDADVLLALGMTRPERAVAAWIPGVVASLAGALLAVPVALGLSPVFPLGTARTADPDVGVHVDILVTLAGVTGIALLGMVVAFVSAWGWSKRTVAVRSDRLSAGARLAARTMLRPAPATGVRFALEPRAGAERLPVRSALIGATGAIVVITAGLLVTSSLDRALRDPAIHGITWDLEVSSGPDPGPAEDFLAADDRISTATFIRTGELNVRTSDGHLRRVSVIGFDDLVGRFDYTVLEGRPPTGVGEVAFSSVGLERTGASVGDEIELSSPNGERTVTIVGRVVMATAEGVTSSGIAADLSVLDELGGSELIAEIDAQPAVLVTVGDPADLDSVRADIEAAGAPTDDPTRPTEVSLLDEVRLVPTYLTVFVAVLGALAAFHVLWTTARRRRPELMVLRALGCRPRDAASAVRWHGLAFTIVVLTVGLPVGAIAGRAIWRSIATERELVVRVDLPWTALTLLAVGTIAGATFVLAWLPARNTARRSVAQELRTE